MPQRTINALVTIKTPMASLSVSPCNPVTNKAAPGVDHAVDGAGLAFAPATARGLAAAGSAGVALTQLLDACELFGRVGGREEAVLDAAALGLRGAVFRCSGVGDAVAEGDGAANAIEGRDAQSGVLSIAAL